jgi:hypothetical protein
VVTDNSSDQYSPSLAENSSSEDRFKKMLRAQSQSRGGEKSSFVNFLSMKREDWLIKMREMQAAGKPLCIKREEPMTPEERKEVGSGAYYQMFMYLVMGVGLCGVPFLANEDELTMFQKNLISTLIFVGYGTLVVMVYKKMQAAYHGTKDVIMGFVTEKSSEQLKKGGRYYYLHIGADELVSVELSVYQQYAVGDAIEVHEFNNWGHVLLSHRRIEISVGDMPGA